MRCRSSIALLTAGLRGDSKRQSSRKANSRRSASPEILKRGRRSHSATTAMFFFKMERTRVARICCSVLNGKALPGSTIPSSASLPIVSSRTNCAHLSSISIRREAATPLTGSFEAIPRSLDCWLSKACGRTLGVSRSEILLARDRLARRISSKKACSASSTRLSRQRSPTICSTSIFSMAVRGLASEATCAASFLSAWRLSPGSKHARTNAPCRTAL